MSLVKQIGIAILATVMLVVFGIGSYAISKQVVPDPKEIVTTATPDPSGVITVKKAKELAPKNITIREDSENIYIEFETVEKVGSVVYITKDRTEKIDTVLQNRQAGITIRGIFFQATSENQPKLTHSVKVPKSSATLTGDTYYYIILMYNTWRVFYGGAMDYTKGPTEPYVLKIN